MFAYVPIQYRSIFGGVIAIGWQTYLSLLNQQAAAVEEAEAEAEVVVETEAEAEEMGVKRTGGRMRECAA
jgi:protein Mpv17